MQDSPRPAAVPYFEARPNRRRSSWIISLFVALNTVIFIVEMFINDCPKDLSDNCFLKFLGRFSFQPPEENPFHGPSSATLQKMGALEWSKVVKEHQGWRLITCIWLHAGIRGLVTNMMGLIFIGIHLLEIGSLKIGIAYLVSAFGGSVLSALLYQNGVSVGASGAVYGLSGVVLSDIFTNWKNYESKFAALVTLLVFFVGNSEFWLLISIGFINKGYWLLPYGDNLAYIGGGFISGLLLGFVFQVNCKNIPPGNAVDSDVNSKHNVCQYILWWLSLILLIVGFTVGLVLLFHGVNSNKLCRLCPDLDSMPTSGRSFNDGVTTCQETGSDTDFTLTCQNGGKTKVYPSLPFITKEKKRQLCNQQCS